MNKYILELDRNRLPKLVEDGSIKCEYEALDRPHKLAETMKTVLADKAEEYLYVVALNTKGVPICAFEVSHGTVSMSVGNPREVFIRALLCGANSIALIHNHPSGNTSPSKEDITMTERMKDAGKLIGIELVDHIIVGDSYFSFAEENYL